MITTFRVIIPVKETIMVLNRSGNIEIDKMKYVFLRVLGTYITSICETYTRDII